MAENTLHGTNYRASFLVPDFVEIQRRSFSQFLEKGITEEFCKINPIKSDISKATLTFYPKRYLLILPDYTITEAVLQGKTYSCKLYLPAILSPEGDTVPAEKNKSYRRKSEAASVQSSLNWEASKKTTRLGKTSFSNNRNQDSLHPNLRTIFAKTTLKNVPSLPREAKKSNAPLNRQIVSNERNDLPSLTSQSDARPVAPSQLATGEQVRESPNSLNHPLLHTDLKTQISDRVLPYQIEPDPALYQETADLSAPGLPLSGMAKLTWASRKLGQLPGKSLQTIATPMRRRDTKAISDLSWVLIGNVPLMTKRGHFIVNGSPRVVVNQLVRSPGVYFHERTWGSGKKNRRVVYADFVSRRGAWLRIQADKDGGTWARLKKMPKIPFPLFYDAMAACERSAKSWTTMDREALLELHEEINPSQKDISAANGSHFLVQRFKNPRAYDLGLVGRNRFNQRFGISLATLQLTSQDLYWAFQHIQELQNDRMLPDDIDHLKNRRVRASGELVQGQFEVGVYRLEKDILGKMRKPSREASPQTLVNSKLLNGAFREFFGSNPLSQYMDQTNPLAEITQKRRITSLGPEGISRETAGMAIRGIHPTHYGRICPIETPEGKNAGLVNSLAAYTRIGGNGILEAPYYSVLQGQVQRRDGFRYLSAEEEERYGSKVAPGDVKSSMCQLLPTKPFPVREIADPQEDFKRMDRAKVSYIAISPVQMISIATSLIPFLEHDDANRALMGSNMQRQAVPLLLPERPLVGTGLEALVVAESGHALQAKASGYVTSVNGATISVYSTQLFNPSPTRNVSASTQTRAHALAGALAGIGARRSPPLGPGLQRPPLAFDGAAGELPAAKVSGRWFSSDQNRARWECSPATRERGVSVVWGCMPTQYTPNIQHPLIKTADGLAHTSAVNDQGKSSRWWAFPLLQGRYTHYQPLKGDTTGAMAGRSSKDWQDPANGADKTLGNSMTSGGKAGDARALPSVATAGGGGESLFEKRNQRLLTKAATFEAGLAFKGLPIVVAYSESSKRVASKNTGSCWNSRALADPGIAVKTRFTSWGSWVAHSGSGNRQSACEPFGVIMNGGCPPRGKGQGLSCLHYPLQNFHRSNQETCLNQIPAVCEGGWVQRGDLLADCSASQFGELALGKNIVIAYMPWEGYNFEDAVVISERLVSDDVYTSVHIQKYEIEIGETSFGFEKITKQIPGASNQQKAHLNWQGIAAIGSWVREGDILVGKVSPRSSYPLSPYERLAYDIANVEAATTEDTSLRVPKGIEGRVISYQAFKATNILLEQHRSQPGRIRIYLAEKRKIQVGDKVAGRHGNKGIISRILPRQDMPYLPDGSVIDMVLNPLGIPSRMNVGQVFECLLGLASVHLGQQFKVTPFDEIYGAEASRSLVYLKLYQARLRTHQDWLFHLSFPGKSVLIDGRTGCPFDQWVTAGKAYMLKLVHLVDEKIHARSTGPYALVTKQPLGGRSKHGGQRLGEMEVWALEGFGAAYTLQEMLTSKSDDIVGREQVVEAILFKGRMSLGNPEAFKVLVRELQSLCLDVGVYAISPGRLQREVIDVGSIL